MTHIFGLNILMSAIWPKFYQESSHNESRDWVTKWDRDGIEVYISCQIISAGLKLVSPSARDFISLVYQVILKNMKLSL